MRGLVVPFLALAWEALTGDFGLLNLALGAVLAWAALRLAGAGGELSLHFLRRLPRLVRFAAFFARELLVANLRVALLVIAPGRRLRPALLAVPLDVERDEEIALLANLITLTPGTLSVDVASDRSVLFVHAVTVDDAEALRAGIKQGLERRVRELFE